MEITIILFREHFSNKLHVLFYIFNYTFILDILKSLEIQKGKYGHIIAFSVRKYLCESWIKVNESC